MESEFGIVDALYLFPDSGSGTLWRPKCRALILDGNRVFLLNCEPCFPEPFIFHKEGDRKKERKVKLGTGWRVLPYGHEWWMQG